MEIFNICANFFMEILNVFANFLRKNIVYVAVSMLATSLAIYGIYIKKGLKAATKKMNFFLRFAVYVFVYAFLLPFLSAQAVMLIAKLLNGLNNGYLVLVVVLTFLVLCILAKNEKQI
jgi:hypothetical protein